MLKNSAKSKNVSQRLVKKTPRSYYSETLLILLIIFMCNMWLILTKKVENIGKYIKMI